MSGVNNKNRANGQVYKYIARDFPSSTALFFLSDDIEYHKKEAYIRPIGFIREL